MSTRLLVLLVASVAAVAALHSPAIAQPADVMEAAAGSGSGSQAKPELVPSAPDGSAAATPADKLADPVKAPAQAWSDLKEAKKTGWAVAVFVALLLLCKLAATARKFPFLAVLGKGKVAVVVGALGALAASCYNAAADGGAWTAMLAAGVTAMAHYIDSGPKA